MGKINLYAPFAGVKDGLTLLTLLQDKKKLKEVLGVVEILDARITEINEAIAVLGKASQMDTLLREAGQKNAEADAAIAVANKRAEDILREAREKTDAEREGLNLRTRTLVAREKEFASHEAQSKTYAERTNADVEKREAAAGKREVMASARLAQATVTKERYEKALSALKVGVAAA